MSRATAVICLSAAALAGMSGCVRPAIEGGQVQELPPGFGYDGNCSAAGGVLQGRRVLRQRCWFTRGEPTSSIVITELEGLVGRAEVEAAREVEAGRHRSWMRVEPMELLQIRGRPGWGWYQISEYGGKLSGIGYVAVLPWGDRSYKIEFSGRREQDRDRGLARDVVTSFNVLRSGDVAPAKVAVALILAAIGALLFRRLRRAQAEAPPGPAGPLTLRERQASSRAGPVPKPPKR